MKASKQDFERVAKMLELEYVVAQENGSAAHTRSLDRIVLSLASAFKQSNPRFDVARFLKAAGYRGE
jgi:hypothetical protein